MTDSAYIRFLENYEGAAACPEDFAAFWERKTTQAFAQISAKAVDVIPVLTYNAAASYALLSFPGTDGTILHARYLRPSEEKKYPALIMYHDIGRGVRGWHHITRFVSMGWSVIALENRAGRNKGDSLAELDLQQMYCDALSTAAAVLSLPETDAHRLGAWGEGFAGGLAIVTASMLGENCKCAAHNPMPAELTAEQAYTDLLNFAPLLKGPFLLGIGLLDQVAKPEGQYAVFHRATCEKLHKVYPRHEHERNNFFENELMKFLR